MLCKINFQRITLSNTEPDRPADVLERQFITDWAYAAFVIDVFSRMVVG